MKKIMVLLFLLCSLGTDVQAIPYQKSAYIGDIAKITMKTREKARKTVLKWGPHSACNREWGYKMCFDKNKSRLRRFGSHYGVSVLLSGSIGAATGGLVKCVAQRLNLVKNIDDLSSSELGLLLLMWILEYEFRNDLITMVQKDLDGYGIDHHKNLMFRTAWLASWLAYFNVSI